MSLQKAICKVINESNFEPIFNINAGKNISFGEIDLIVPDEYSLESFKILLIQNKLEGQIYSDKIKRF